MKVVAKDCVVLEGVLGGIKRKRKFLHSIFSDLRPLRPLFRVTTSNKLIDGGIVKLREGMTEGMYIFFKYSEL